MALKFSTNYLEDSITLFRYYKKLGEGAMQQLADEQLLETIDAESNSVAVIVKHMSGNMLSRWTDFLTSDGEKPTRNRDGEFEGADITTRSQVMRLWEEGWRALFGALEPMTEQDLSRTITIRSEPHSVMQAINRQMAHYSYHVGQIVFVAKHLRSSEWKSLSVPRNKSAEFNARVKAGEASQR
jgi:hypothetical protein